MFSHVMADQMNRFKDSSAESANVKKLRAGEILREYKLRAIWQPDSLEIFELHQTGE